MSVRDLHVDEQAREDEMDSAMRDLDRIRESDVSRSSRRIIVMLAALVLVAVAGSTGVAWIPTAHSASADTVASFASLDIVAAGHRQMAAEGGAASRKSAASSQPGELDRSRLIFPELLTSEPLGADARPEVEAAVAAAAAELERLEATMAAGAAVGSNAPFPPIPSAAAELPTPVAQSPSATDGDAESAASPVAPAAVSLDAAALHVASLDQAPAAPGHEGPYGLQVVSYTTAREAELFANALRARGHRAYVQAADVPGRGRYWRVRIGPFDSAEQADAYRRSFEREERIHTIVVRRRSED
ncbi:MAG: SPOR domain-containing protein [Myxococcota bacterium]|nr:SPOR domain-containing protein [Myxococcota bacterium]